MNTERKWITRRSTGSVDVDCITGRSTGSLDVVWRDRTFGSEISSGVDSRSFMFVFISVTIDGVIAGGL